MWPIVLNNGLPSEGFKIMIRSPVTGQDCEENGVTHIFEAQDGKPLLSTIGLWMAVGLKYVICTVVEAEGLIVWYIWVYFWGIRSVASILTE